MMRPEATRGGSEPVTRDLLPALEAVDRAATERMALAPGAMLIRGVAAARAGRLLAELQRVLDAAPPRHMVTPGGFRMSVAMSNCGAVGWVSDAGGSPYDAIQPPNGRPWAPMPASFLP